MKQTQDELAAAKQELAEEKYNYSTLTIISQQLNQQLETERADRQQLQTELDQTLAELAKLKENPQPAIEAVGEFDHALTTPEEALAHAAIFGFTPEEALADTHFQINMLTANYDELEDKYEAAKRELAELRSELAELKENPQPAIDLSERLPEIYNFLKKWLPADTKWPKKTLPELRKFLESKEEK